MRMMLGLTVLAALGLAAAGTIPAHGQMIKSDSLHQDPKRLALCIKRTLQTHAFDVWKVVPFEIDQARVDFWQRNFPDMVFFASPTGELITCGVNSATGLYGPTGSIGEMSYWHLIRPRDVPDDENTMAFQQRAIRTCFAAVTAKIGPKIPKEQGYFSFQTMPHSSFHGARASRPIFVSGVKAVPYDVIIRGNSLYPSPGIDQKAVGFNCLLGPRLNIKAISLSK